MSPWINLIDEKSSVLTYYSVDYILGNKSEWNFNLNTKYLIQENAFENVVHKMGTIL